MNRLIETVLLSTHNIYVLVEKYGFCFFVCLLLLFFFVVVVLFCLFFGEGGTHS